MGSQVAEVQLGLRYFHYMTTRSGHTYKAMTDTETDTSAQQDPSTNQAIQLAQMMQAMLEDRRQREAEIAEDRRRREQENEERMTGMREQIDIMLRRLVSERGTITPDLRTSNRDEPRLNRLTEQDDIKAFLLTFERMMRAYEVSPTRWAYKLAPQLTGKAYAALNSDESVNYEAVKQAILRRYNINEVTYRRQLYTSSKAEGKGCTTIDALFDLIVKEQLLNCLPDDAAIWVRERKPKDSVEAGQLAEDFLQAREQKGRDSTIKTRESRPSPPGNCPRCSQPGHWASECPTQRGRTHTNPQRNNDKTRKPEWEIICYNCNEKGHMSFNCPKTTGLYCE